MKKLVSLAIVLASLLVLAWWVVSSSGGQTPNQTTGNTSQSTGDPMMGGQPAETNNSGQADVSSSANLKDSLTRNDKGEGGVQVTVTYFTGALWEQVKGSQSQEDPQLVALLEKENPDKSLVFYVALNTHSGSLSSFDLAKMSTLTAGGSSGLKALRWIDVANDSHHRSGLLVFADPGSKKNLTLDIANLANASSRTFSWNT